MPFEPTTSCKHSMPQVAIGMERHTLVARRMGGNGQRSLRGLRCVRRGREVLRIDNVGCSHSLFRVLSKRPSSRNSSSLFHLRVQQWGSSIFCPNKALPKYWLDDATTENKQTSSHIQEQRAKFLCVTLRAMNECLGIL